MVTDSFPTQIPEFPLLINTRHRWLGNINLHSQWEAFSSQPSGNLDVCLKFHQGTTGWVSSRSETSLDAGDVFPLWCSKETLEIQRPWENYNHPYILQGLSFMNLVVEKGQKHRTTLDMSGSHLTVSWIPAIRLPSQVLMLFTSHLWRSKSGKSFGQRAVWLNDHGNHMGQDEKESLLVFCSICSLVFLLLRTSTWR